MNPTGTVSSCSPASIYCYLSHWSQRWQRSTAVVFCPKKKTFADLCAWYVPYFWFWSAVISPEELENRLIQLIGSVNGTTFFPATNTSIMLRSSPVKQEATETSSKWVLNGERHIEVGEFQTNELKLILTQIQELFQKNLKMYWWENSVTLTWNLLLLLICVVNVCAMKMAPHHQPWVRHTGTGQRVRQARTHSPSMHQNLCPLQSSLSGHSGTRLHAKHIIKEAVVFRSLLWNCNQSWLKNIFP